MVKIKNHLTNARVKKLKNYFKYTFPKEIYFSNSREKKLKFNSTSQSKFKICFNCKTKNLTVKT